ncbi:MAG: protein kinase [Prosthecobacter sp.]
MEEQDPTLPLPPPSDLQRTTNPHSKPKQWQPPSTEELHKLLPQYEITALLGRGGMGAVYKGTQINLERTVAIKILPPGMDDEDSGANFTERFKNEARAMAKLSHPGIVAVYDSGETAGGLLYIVMEFIEGTDVQKMVAQQRRLHSEHAMAITAHVCDALQYAHERGIIHRDIKPANIMVGYDGVVKVADFGLAKMDRAGELGLTRSGMAMGTLHYMAPEALMLGSGVDHRADIYAVGVMLYFMLTGRLPQGMFELPSMQVPGLDPRFDGIIAKALRNDRDIRYQTTAELRRDLDGILTQPVVKVEADAGKAPAALETQARPQRPAGQPFRPPPPKVIVRTEQKSSPLRWAALIVMSGAILWLGLSQRAATSIPTTEVEPDSAALPASSNHSPASQTPVEPKAADLPVTQSLSTGVWHDLLAEKVIATSGMHRTADSGPAEPHYLVTASSMHKITPHVFRDCILRVRFSGDWLAEPTLFLRCVQGNSVVESISAKFEGVNALLSRHQSPQRITTLESVKLEPPLTRNSSVELELKVIGDKYTLLRDGVMMAEAVDPAYISGRVGIFVTRGTIIEKLEVMPLVPAASGTNQAGAAEASDSVEWRSLLEDKPGLVQKLQITDSTTPGWKVMPKGFFPVLDEKNVALRLKARSYKQLRIVTFWSETPQNGIFGYTLRIGPSQTGKICLFNGWIDETSTIDGVLQPKAYQSTKRNPPFEVLEGQEFELEVRTIEDRLYVLVDGKEKLEVPTELPGQVTALHPFGPMEFKELSWRRLAPSIPSTSAARWDRVAAQGHWENLLGEKLEEKLGFEHSSTGSLPFGGPDSVERLPALPGFPFRFRFTRMTSLYSLATLKDGAVRARIVCLDVKQPWLFAHHQDLYHYVWGVHQSTRALLTLHPSKSIPIAETKQPLFNASDKPFELELRVLGSHYTLLQDGEILVEGDDSTYSSGHVGVRLYEGMILEKLEVMSLDSQAESPVAGTLPADKTAPPTASPSPAPVEPIHPPSGTPVWIDAKGRSITAEFVRADSTTITIRMNGKEVPVPLSNLSHESRQLASLLASTGPNASSSEGSQNIFINTLGMKFVPVPGTKVLFCIHETRYGDFAAFAAGSSVSGSWKNQNYGGVEISTRKDEHPVTNVTGKQAVQFCAWLSQKESRKYRLPTKEEWSLAASAGGKAEFPWGDLWPPPAGAGNYSDESYHKLRPTDPYLTGFDDGFPTTAPVMSFKPNALGIYDLGGNIAEMTHAGDPAAAAFQDYPPMVQRGASFLHDVKKTLRSANESPSGSSTGTPDKGFRVVVEIQ